jgi:hypothetical protein
MQHQAQEQDYFESEFGDDSLTEKRKRLAGAPDPNRAPAAAPQAAGTNRYDVEILAWQFLGTIGVLLTLGAFVLGLVASNPAMLVIPLIYMVAVMFLMRR